MQSERNRESATDSAIKKPSALTPYPSTEKDASS
jgi:hypothetical protein